MIFIIQKAASVSYGGKILIEHNFRKLRVLNPLYKKWHHFDLFQPLSTNLHSEMLSWEASSHDVLLSKLQVSLKDRQLDEAWLTFNDFKTLYGFPQEYMVSRLLTELAYSSNPDWLQKSCNLVSQILKEKPDLLPNEVLMKLSLCFARANMPVSASMILRVMLERDNMVVASVSLLRLIVLHLVKTEVGTCIVSNFLIQICERYLDSSPDRYDHAKVLKPDTLMFNLVLDACVRFRSSLKGLELVEWMSRTGIMADADTIVIIARIYEISGLRDEIQKFKDPVDQVSARFVCHYQQFYEVLLNLHFKFDDLDAAAELVSSMNRLQRSTADTKHRNDLPKPFLIPIGSQNLKAGIKIQIFPEVLQEDSVIKVEQEMELISFKNGKFLLSNKALAKFILGHKRQGRISEFTKILLSMHENFQTIVGSNLCYDVIDACVRLGWLETAHDILDDMEIAGLPCSLGAYRVLLTSYYDRGMSKEAETLVRQIRKAGFVTNFSVDMVPSSAILEGTDKLSSSFSKSDLSDFLVQEMGEEKVIHDDNLYKLNSSIYFFCKAKMMGEALKAYRRMQKVGIEPTSETFAYLVYGYSSLKRYRDITFLWGDIKRAMKNRNLSVRGDVYESLVINFLRGGYFERVMEVAGCMIEYKMYTDKGMYKSEFLKLHKNLYKGLNAARARNDVQRKRLQFVQKFRKWVGID